MLLLLAILMQEFTPYADEVIPTPIPQPSPGITLTIDEQAVASIQKSEPIRVIVYVQPNGVCPPCDAMKADVGAGDDSIIVEYTKENPPFVIRSYPTVYMPAIEKVWSGRATLANLRWWHGIRDDAVSAPQAVGTASIGDYAKFIDAITLGTISGVLPNQTIDFGSARVRLAGATWTMTANGPRKSVKFTGSLPALEYGIASVSLNGVEYEPDAITLKTRGFRDWKLNIGK